MSSHSWAWPSGKLIGKRMLTRSPNGIVVAMALESLHPTSWFGKREYAVLDSTNDPLLKRSSKGTPTTGQDRLSPRPRRRWR